MKIKQVAAALGATTLLVAAPALAQTTHETKVVHDTRVHDGTATTTTRVTETSKRKTRQPKKVLGVKVGHKTETTKVVKETAVSSNGDHKTVVKTSH
ncbi:hypothetical protein K7957_18855 [Sphingomonas yunnanensis]|uniref:hypothetical protein n=1 Tax=Sphingomonas yunnanensis TaxID=310400 RepID=UPI001CA75F92|nr:hypothetical protein [Sphingomonas yunnanensis]MBY9064998.1 hypothetical protein [Sphingomonas yunnanensis]